MSNQESIEIALHFLRKNRLALFASIGADTSAPQASCLYYVVEGVDQLYLVTRKESRKIPNIRKNKKIALVVAQEVEPLELQIEGDAEIITDTVLEASILKKFLAVATANPASMNFPPVVQLFEKGFCFIKITISWMRYSDFSGTEPLVFETTY